MSNYFGNDFSDSTKIYYKELKKCKPLSRDEELTLLKKAKNNDLKAKNKILTSNLKFVFGIAKHYKGKGVSIDDLISEGNMGLIKAIDKFDINKNVRFISYGVWWIRQFMQEFIKREQKKSIYELKDESEDSNNNDDADNEDEEVRNNQSVVNIVKDESCDYEAISNFQLSLISKLLSKLDKRCQFIISYYFGLNGLEQLTLDEIGAELNISKERTRQLKDKSLKILRTEILLLDEDEIIF